MNDALFPSIDVHAHVGKTVANNIGQSVEQMLRRMDEGGLTQALLSPAAADRQVDGLRDTQRMNDTVAEAVRDHSDRFPGGFGLVEPRHEEHAVTETIRIVDELGLLGIAVHPMLEGYYLDTPLRVEPIFEVLDDRRSFCLMHCSPDPGSGESPAAVRAVVSKYRNVTTFLGHAFLTEKQLKEAAELVREFDHVYFDVAYQSDPKLTERLVSEVGSDRVVFGTDQPFYDPAAVHHSVLQANISDSDRRNILHDNARRLLDGRD
ncbi:amidohydrolase family protein [uncultured Leifsonia sp.]|uniref:amidohydrolase family protein n=1 Tax=uncultured Leifsonia sp. TaxID=340359 RepID=UPI0028D1B129|nr:amidohydrolase family protein [uncultured Leifsonia sp.]